jgi:hypothetical protein
MYLTSAKEGGSTGNRQSLQDYQWSLQDVRSSVRSSHNDLTKQGLKFIVTGYDEKIARFLLFPARKIFDPSILSTPILSQEISC